MDVLTWIWWLLSGLLGFVLSLTWFLLGGWVVTLAQIAVVALVIFGWKYGWQRAPQELATRTAWLGRFGWSFVRRRPMRDIPLAERSGSRQRNIARRRAPGDVNLSTLLNLAMLIGLWLLAGVAPR
jgi:hypothetical protein